MPMTIDSMSILSGHDKITVLHQENIASLLLWFSVSILLYFVPYVVRIFV